MSENNLNLENTPKVQLKRTVGFWNLVFFGLVFMQPTSGLTYFGYTQLVSHGLSVMTFAIGAIVVFFTCLSYAKMVTIYPNAGSAYVYASKGLNSKIGFLVGWTMLLDYVLNPMLIFAVCGLYLNRFVPSVPVAAWVVIFAVAVWGVNVIGLKVAKFFNIGAAFFQILLAAAFVVLTFIYLSKTGHVDPATVVYRKDDFNIFAVMGGTTVVILTFLGFDGISTIAEETTVSSKKVGTAIKTAVIIQAVILVSLTFIASMVFPDYKSITNVDTIVYDLYTTIGGQTFNTVAILLGQFLAIMGANTIVMSGSRLLYSMGREEVIPNKIFGYLSPKFNTPTRAVSVIIIICIIGAMIIPWTVISEIVAFGAMVGFACVNVSVIRQFFFVKKEHNIITNMIFPILGLISVLFVMVTSSSACKIIGCSWLAIGIIYLLIRYKASEKFRNSINNGLNM